MMARKDSVNIFLAFFIGLVVGLFFSTALFVLINVFRVETRYTADFNLSYFIDIEPGYQRSSVIRHLGYPMYTSYWITNGGETLFFDEYSKEVCACSAPYMRAAIVYDVNHSFVKRVFHTEVWND